MLQRGIGLLLLVLLACGSLPSAGQTTGRAFVPGFEDLPLMPGLQASSLDPVVFDKPDGRIVESAARGAVRLSDVLPFYRSALPQLGWRILDEASFGREGEVLRIELAGRDDDVTVHFLLTPS